MYHPIFLSQNFTASTRHRHSLFNFSGSNPTPSVDNATKPQPLEADRSGPSPISGTDEGVPGALVPTDGLQSCCLSTLLSQEQLEHLNTMDKLRAYGISEFVSLPQIVVCGDQSAGKCFFTFRHTIESFNELPELIEQARAAMCLGSSSTFSQDVLSIEISGPTQPHLTVVDLPGLIHVDGKSQDSSDVELVSNLVGSYMQNPHNIILAVVIVMNDFQNQIVLQRAKKVDPEGRRTLGVIAKPDSIPVGSEKEDAFIFLAKNEDIFFALGWHVLRNRRYEERNDSTEDRNFREELFSQTGTWKNIPNGSVGIETLWTRLSQLLYAHIKHELPKVYKDNRNGLQNGDEMHARLGAKRETTFEQRQFLAKISMEFVNVCKAAVDAHYEDKFFGEGVVVDTSNKNRYPYSEGGSRKITRAEAIDWVKPLGNSRGRELSGTFDSILICPLFREQSMKWEDLTIAHLGRSFAACQKIFQVLVLYVSREAVEGEEELDKLFEDHRSHAITHNHYYTDVIQKFGQESSKMQNLHLAKGFSKGLDKTVASEAISRFVVERHLMRGLWDVFSPIAVLSMPDQLVERSAAESAKGRNLRKRSEVQKERLMKSLEACRKVLLDVAAD
ncbi:P-loop containing nucleoside triphosphate hydrolase protein [Trichophaea hybrida]|nr:P-loop containing nucleoside triphosphate hydrolase protein [Trichophaea hybrida]